MLFLELAAQSVRGFSPSVRVTLKPGYNALTSPVELPAPVSGLVVALAFPDGRGGDGAFLAPGAKSGRAGLSIQGNDGSVWRVVRDLGGSGGLHKLNRANNTFEIVTQEAGEMGQTLRSSAGFPARTTWEQLFTLNAAQLPTRRPKGPAKAAAPAGLGKGAAPRMMSKWDNFDANAAGEGGGDVDPSRLPELEKELATAKRTAEVQFRVDAITSELYEVEAKVKAVDALAEEVRSARAEASRYDKAELTDEFIAHAKKLPDEKRRVDDQIARLQEEQRVMAESAPAAPDPLQKDQRFLGAMVAGLGLFIGAMFGEGAVRYLAVLSLVPFSFAALLALRFIEDLQRLSRGGGKSEVLASREKKLTDDYAMHQAAVQKVFESIGVSNLDEFLSAMESRANVKARLVELEQREAGARDVLQTSGVQGRFDKLKGEQEKLNQELLGMSGGFVRDVRDIEREIAKIKAPAAPRPAKPAAAASEFEAVATDGEKFEDPTPALLLLATDVFTADIPTLWAVLKDRAVQYVSALTDRRFHGLSVDKDGHLTAEAPGRTLKAGELPGRDLDLIYLALRLTVIEKASAHHKLPVVIEDTFHQVFEAPKQPLFGRMVKHLGSLTQVIHVGGAGHSGTLADAAIAI